MSEVFSKFKTTKTSWAISVSLLGVSFFMTVSLFLAILGYEAVGQFVDSTSVDSMLMVIFPVGLALAVWGGAKFILARESSSIKDFLSLRKPKKNAIWLVPIAIVTYVLILIVALAILTKLNPVAANEKQDVATAVESLGGWRLLASVIGVGLITPIGEELFFRGLLLKMYLKRLNKYWAIALSALLFGLAHAQLNISLDTFIFGLFLGFITLKTESIYPAIGMHMLKNGLALLVILHK